ncbi:MAG: AAA family ATPase [Candidatus Marinimicrobia bacterium]|nr:AAA family ATPase [Candidatus Neomarinimicrobiota bacterium]
MLDKISLIGLGQTNESQTEQFKSEMKIDDIVLVKRGKVPIALVKIVGGWCENGIKDNDLSVLDWFQYRRGVEILNFAKGSNQADFPAPLGTLRKAIDENSDSYKYIVNWYKKVDAGIMLRHIFIENFKMFKKVNISFSKDNKALPLIVIAGINGSGKTTLFEYIFNFTKSIKEGDESYIKFDDVKAESIERVPDINDKLGKTPLSNLFNKSLIYLPSTNNISEIKKDLGAYWLNLMKREDLRPSETTQRIIDKINSFLGDLDLHVVFDGMDEYDEIYFKNDAGIVFPIDALSSGEKTILSKILSLFVQDVRGKVILIDEPELSLHPSWQNKILKVYETFAKTNNCQVIIATHSPHIIGSAKNEYLRLLRFTKDNNVEVISELSEGYGLEFSKVLTNIMGVEETRTPDIAKKINDMWDLLENEEHKTIEYKKIYSELESILGSLDQDLVLARLEVAKLEAGNA